MVFLQKNLIFGESRSSTLCEEKTAYYTATLQVVQVVQTHEHIDVYLHTNMFKSQLKKVSNDLMAYLFLQALSGDSSRVSCSGTWMTWEPPTWPWDGLWRWEW